MTTFLTTARNGRIIVANNRTRIVEPIGFGFVRVTDPTPAIKKENS